MLQTKSGPKRTRLGCGPSPGRHPALCAGRSEGEAHNCFAFSRKNPAYPTTPLLPSVDPAILNRAHPAQISYPSNEVADMSAKYIFVTGGVVSSLGKGLAAASIGC